MTISRREFCEHLAVGGGLLAGGETMAESLAQNIANAQPTGAAGSHIGNLYPFVQGQADQSPLTLSFLRPEFKSLKQWQGRARTKVFELLSYAPPLVKPQPQLVRRTDKGDYIEEYLTFQTTPDLRVPAYVLIPRKAATPAPGVVLLHDHGGFYVWGKEKVVASENEHPVLSEFKQTLYAGRSI